MSGIILPEGASWFDKSDNLYHDLKQDYIMNSEVTGGEYICTCYFDKSNSKSYIEHSVKMFLVWEGVEDTDFLVKELDNYYEIEY